MAAPVIVDGESINENEKDTQKTSTDTLENGEPGHVNYPHGFKLIAIMFALCLTVFCVALDNTIIATAIPKITDDFHSLNDIGWYGSAYLLTTCAFQLLFGKIYALFPVKWVFLTCLGVFEIGSLVCGVAPTSKALIVGRAVAGLGSAGLFSGALITVAYSTPMEKRSAYIGLIGGMYGIASVAGPLIGGAFANNVTWRWCFYLNLPIGAVSAIVILAVMRIPPRKDQDNLSARNIVEQLDLLGTALFVPAIICVLLALQWGGTTYAWNSARIIALFVLFGVLLIAFIAVQIWKGDTATVPPRIITQRSMAFGSLFAFCLGGSFFLFIYYIPIWLQAINNDSPIRSGIDTLPFLFSQVLIMVVTGGLITQLGHYMPFVFASVVFMSVGAGLITTFTTDTAPHIWIGYTIIYGLGAGFGFQLPTLAAQAVLDIKDVPTGTATIMFMQLLGGALFISAGENVFLNQLVSNLVDANIPGLDPQTVARAGATELKITVVPQYLGQVQVAYNGALVKTFQIALILSCLSVLGAAGMQWKSVKAKKTAGMAG